MIGDDVEVSVLAVSGDKVRLGITAPREVPVFRQEIYDEMSHQKADVKAGADAASAGDPDAASAEVE